MCPDGRVQWRRVVWCWYESNLMSLALVGEELLTIPRSQHSYWYCVITISVSGTPVPPRSLGYLRGKKKHFKRVTEYGGYPCSINSAFHSEI